MLRVNHHRPKIAASGWRSLDAVLMKKWVGMRANIGQEMPSKVVELISFLLSLQDCRVELSARVFLPLVEVRNSFVDSDTDLPADAPGQATLPLLTCQDLALYLGAPTSGRGRRGEGRFILALRKSAITVSQGDMSHVSSPPPGGGPEPADSRWIWLICNNC